MKIINNLVDMVNIVEKINQNNNTIGFIPTMGALHKGHLSLIQKAREENHVVIVSIFVNPKQFNNFQDLERYPRQLEQDINFIKISTNYIFTPSEEDMYPFDFQTAVSVGSLAKKLEGMYRPGHFEGMATIVLKLLNICRPTRVYVGLKDYQQYIIVSQMVKDLNIATTVVGMPTIREPSGLAMSSRNVRLLSVEKEIAANIYTILKDTKTIIQNGMRDSEKVEQYMSGRFKSLPKSRLEYAVVRSKYLEKVRIIDRDTILLVALYIGEERLIDNLIIDF